MLLNWQSHQEYCHFLHEAKVHFDHSQRSRLTGEFAAAREKLRLLNLDPVMKLLQPCYPPLGRPAINQTQILRSLILMLHQGYVSIAAWVEKLKSDSLPAFLIGCTPHSLPPLGSYYDFIDRLWLQDKQFYKSGRKECFPADKNRKPAMKPGKGKKLPNRHPEITKIMANAAVSRDTFPFYYEKLLHEAFRVAAILPSIRRGLINKGGITLSGDGTCVHTHASPYGHNVCSCPAHKEKSCNCPRHFSDPDAHWGWDSDLGTYYFGYTLYMLSYHDSRLSVDLPLHIRLPDARRHDSVSGIVTLKEFRVLNPDITVQNLCFDSANDNYPTYNLCKTWGIRPFIDLNANRGMPKSIPDEIKVDKDGTPVCQAGYRMVYWGYCSGRSRCK